MALVTPLFLPTKTYPFQRLRDMLAELGLQEGVYGATDFKASQRAAGADRSVDVAAGTLLLAGDDTSRQGAYKHYNDGTVNVAATPNTSGTDRVDQLVLQNYDSSILGSSDTPQLMILAGTPSAGCQVSNPGAANYRAGAAALPNSAVRLGEWVATNGYTQITTAMIVDRRPWARGAQVSTSFAGTDYTTASTSWTEIDATNLKRRIECSGATIETGMTVTLAKSTAGEVNVSVGLNGSSPNGPALAECQPTSSYQSVSFRGLFVIPAGSHLFSPYWTVASGGGTATMRNSYTQTHFWVRETVQQNTGN